MSFLQDTVLPGTTGFHSISPDARKLSSQSYAELLTPLVRLVRDTGKTLENIVGGLSLEGEDASTGVDSQRAQVLHARMQNATCYDDWKAAATELDRLEDNDAWKLETESPEYNVALVEARLKQLDDARISCDVNRMLFLIRTSLTRGLGGMGDLRLYKHSHIGTKALIERYIESAKETIKALLEVSAKQKGKGLEPRYVLEQMLAARQSFGRSALLLSGGGTFGMNHIGVVKALWEAKLLPRIISGASAGSIVSAVLCTKTDEEIPLVVEDFCNCDLEVFEKEGVDAGILNKIARFLKYGTLFDISHLVRVMRGMLGDLTFQEAYNRTRRILNITVSSASLYELPRLLNYVTAPNVIIWSAVAASCSVPFVFSAASLLAKDPKTGKEVPWDPSPQRWIDGSVDNDLPMNRLAEMFNVNHFIVSQVNPHVVPFLVKEESSIAKEAQQSTSAFAAGPRWLHSMANLAKGEALHRMRVLAELGIFPNYFTKARSVLSQKYSGDITIFPEISYTNFPRILSNPDLEFIFQAVLAGERATWPKLSRVQNHCAIELALDDAAQHLRARVVFSPSQVDLRLSAFARPTSQGGDREQRRRRRSRPPHSTSRSVEINRGMLRLNRQSAPLHLDIPSFTPRHLDHHRHEFARNHQKSPSYDSTVKVSHEDAQSSSDDDEHHDDLISSDVETDNGISSPNSPPSPSPMPELWPTTRQLFPFSSQPTTPSIASRSFTKIPGCGSNLQLTSAKESQENIGPSRPEQKVFHSRGSATLGTSNQKTPPPPPPAWGEDKDAHRKRGKLGLLLDISGTRGMIRRRRMSVSGTRPH